MPVNSPIPPLRLRRILRNAALILFSAGLAVGAVACRRSTETEEATTPRVPVESCRIEPRTVEDTLTLSGEIIPLLEIEIQPKIEGTLQRVHFREGDWVRAGDVLFDFEDVEIRARLQQAQAELANRQAVLARLTAGERPQDILAAEARVARASALYENRLAQLQRLESIRTHRSDQEITDQQSEVELARAELRVAQAELQRAYAGSRPEDITAARADVAFAHAALDLAHEFVSSAHLRSTTDGLIVERNMEPGERVAPGMVLLRLLKTDPLWARVRVPESAIARIRKDQPCTLRLAAYDREFPGTVDVVGGDLDRPSRSLGVKILVPNPDGLLKPGMFATVTLQTGRRDDVLLVDRDWLHFRQGRAYLHLVEDGIARERRVETGASYARFVEITEGLEPGEMVIVSDYGDLADGSAITIVAVIENMDETMVQAEVPVVLH